MAGDSLKPHWFYILLALADEDRHGLAIARDVQSLSDGAVRLWPATLYGSLDELRARRWIEELDEHPAEESERKRYYRITKTGRRGADRRGRAARTAGAAGAGARADRGSAVSRAVSRAAGARAAPAARPARPPTWRSCSPSAWPRPGSMARAAVAAVWMRAVSDLLHARVGSWKAPRVPLTVYIDERTTLMPGSDIRYAWRALLRQRGASALVIFMLALGIAANVAVFSLVNGLFLRPFPVPAPRPAGLHQHRRAEMEPRCRRHQLSRLRSLAQGPEAVRGDRRPTTSALQRLGRRRRRARPRRRSHAATFTKVLGIEPLLGRTFTAEEDRAEGASVS